MKNILFNEDNLTTMKKMPDNYISGIITSPPYNINTKRNDGYYNNGYSDIDNLSEEDYLTKRTNEFKEFSRIMKDDAVICYNISYHTLNPILPTLLMAKIHNETDLTVADVIAWKKPHAIPFQSSATKLSRICELIYVVVKKSHSNSFKTNKVVSKINEKTGQKFYKHYVNHIEAKNNDGTKSLNKATYSTELVDKLIFIYFPENSIIYDPFMGIGTTAKGCIKNDCHYIGSELIEEFHLESIKSIEDEKEM